jgi:hypothetical protein
MHHVAMSCGYQEPIASRSGSIFIDSVIDSLSIYCRWDRSNAFAMDSSSRCTITRGPLMV